MRTVDHLDAMRKRIQAHLAVLGEARSRRDLVLAVAGTFAGALRTFVSGSLATGFVNHPVDDADCGLVLDRRVYPALGPDGLNELPRDIVDAVHTHLRRGLQERYPNVRIEKMKRGLLIRFNEPIDGGQDPTVDLVITLNRAQDDALWIPNLERECWDPSHPERHVELFTAGSAELRRTRAWTTRLGKAWKGQWDECALCSFNIAALVREAITEPMPLDRAMLRFFSYSESAIAAGPTGDPAGVSEPIKLPLGQVVAVKRLSAAAAGVREALEHDDDPKAVAAALATVFFCYVEAPGGTKSAAATAARVGLLVPAVAPTVFRGARSYGER